MSTSQRVAVTKCRFAVGSVSVASRIPAGASNVAQQLLGAGLGQLGHALAVGAGGVPVEVWQAGDGAVPAQVLEEFGVVETRCGLLELGDSVGGCHVAAP